MRHERQHRPDHQTHQNQRPQSHPFPWRTDPCPASLRHSMTPDPERSIHHIPSPPPLHQWGHVRGHASSPIPEAHWVSSPCRPLCFPCWTRKASVPDHQNFPGNKRLQEGDLVHALWKADPAMLCLHPRAPNHPWHTSTSTDDHLPPVQKRLPPSSLPR